MRILLELSYLGSAYFGWQIQPDVPTVQGEINRALGVLYGCDILTQGSSRTDRGVHAKSFFCHFDTDKSFDILRLPMALNANLPRDISVLSAKAVPDDFHARFAVKCKTYEYLIWNDPMRNALYSDRALHWWYEADVDKMDKAAKELCGTHDFAAFKAQGSPVETTVRTIFDAGVERDGNFIKIRVTGDGFLYNMVRIIVGTLLYMARGKIPFDAMPELIKSIDRTKTGPTVGPEGLYLVKTEYKDGI